MTRLPLALAVALATASGALAQDVVTPLGGGLYRAEFWTIDVDTLYSSDRTAPPDTVLVRVIYGAEDAVSPVVGVHVEAEGDSLRYRYTVGNGPEGPRALYVFELLPNDYADDLRVPDATWRAGAHRRLNTERQSVEIMRYSWAQTDNYTPDGSAYLPKTLQPGVSLDGFSLLSAGLPAVVDARASADRLLYPEDSTLAVYGLWSVAQVVNHGRAPNLEALRYESRYAPLRTLGPRAVPDPLDGPAFLDSLLADVREADALGWFGAAMGSAVEGQLAEARDAWAAGDSARASLSVRAAGVLVEADADVRPEGRALVSFNGAFLARHLPGPSDAQTVYGHDPCLPEYVVLPDEFTGPDPDGLPLDEALDLALRARLDVNGLENTIGRAVLHARPRHAPLLKAIAERYRCDGTVSERALLALVFLGEPSAYFVGLAEARVRDGFHRAGIPINVLAARADPAVVDDVRRVRRLARGTPAERSLNYGSVDGMDPYAAAVRDAALFHARPVADRALDAAAVTLAGYLNSGLLVSETGEFFVTEFAMTYEPRHAWWLARYREVARSHPTAAAEAVDGALAALASGEQTLNVVVDRPPGASVPAGVKYTAAELAALTAVARDSVASLAPGLVSAPPVDPGADVRPGPVCVEDHVLWDGEAVRLARFGYVLSGRDSVRVPPGPSNGVRGTDGSPPEAFYRGRGEWVARVSPGAPATWTLLGRSVTADADSERCDGSPRPRRP